MVVLCGQKILPLFCVYGCNRIGVVGRGEGEGGGLDSHRSASSPIAGKNVCIDKSIRAGVPLTWPMLVFLGAKLTHK